MNFLDYVSLSIGYVGIVVIVWGVIRTLLKTVALELTKCKHMHTCCEREGLRREFGSYLLLGLEFLIAADVVNTVSHPTLVEVAVLGSIVAIRTVISFFLTRELKIALEQTEAIQAVQAADKSG